jgi:hypothetical protein
MPPSFDDPEDLEPSNLELADVAPPPPAQVSTYVPRNPVADRTDRTGRSVRPPSIGSPRALEVRGTGGRRVQLALGALGMIGAVVGLFLWLRPMTVPDLVVLGPEKAALHLDDLRDGHKKLLLVVVVPGDTMSRFAMTAAKEQYAAKSGFLAFAGLYVGKQADAERFRVEMDLPFPVYGLNDSPDPFSVQDFVKKIGISSFVSSGVYGGTTVLLNDQRVVLFRLEKDGVRTLRDKLAAVTD